MHDEAAHAENVYCELIDTIKKLEQENSELKKMLESPNKDIACVDNGKVSFFSKSEIYKIEEYKNKIKELETRVCSFEGKCNWKKEGTK